MESGKLPSTGNWIHLFETSLPDLLAMEALGGSSGDSLESTAEGASPHHSAFQLYLRTLCSYLSGDTEELRRNQVRISRALANSRDEGLPQLTQVGRLTDLRIQIREQTPSEEAVQTALHRSSRLGVEWQAETSFVAGKAYSVLKQPELSIRHYMDARDLFRQAGARKKAIKAEWNAFSEGSPDLSSQKCIRKYRDFFRISRAAAEYGTAGMALMAVAEKFQTTGAFSAAQRVMKRALWYLKHEAGTLHYYLGIAFESYLLASLGRSQEARIFYEIAHLSPFPDIQEVLHPLEASIVRPDLESSPIHARCSHLGELEEKLVAILREGPRTRKELIRLVYGSRLDPVFGDLRLKQVIFRARKKVNGSIRYRNNLYFLQ